MASPQKGAQAPQQPSCFIDESGGYPWPRGVRTYAPVGHPPIVQEWWPREHLSALSAMSPEGKLYVHCQDSAITSEDGIAFLAHLRREVPGRLVIIWHAAPIHRSHVVKDLLAMGGAVRLHRERLPAYVPERNPGEGLWAQLQGVERRHGCGFNLLHLRAERRHAVTRVRRTPRLIKGFFRGANL